MPSSPVPAMNADHLKIIPYQQRARGWKGQIATNPNCSTVVLAMALAPLKQFGIRRVIATTMQAISGAGYPGVASMDINANVIPFIGGEEEAFENQAMAWQASTVYFAVIELVAAVGLWLATPWGAVVWLTTVVSMAVIELMFPGIYGGSLTVVAFEAIMLSAYLVLAWMAARERPP